MPAIFRRFLRSKLTIVVGLLALICMAMAMRVVSAQGLPLDSSADVVTTGSSAADELAGINRSLAEIAVYLGALLDRQQVDVLMTRIQMTERRIEPLQRELTGARAELDGLREEAKRLAMLKEDWERQLQARDPVLPEDEAMKYELRHVRGQLELSEQRQAALEQKILEIENEIEERRKDIRTLEETVDERLELR